MASNTLTLRWHGTDLRGKLAGFVEMLINKLWLKIRNFSNTLKFCQTCFSIKIVLVITILSFSWRGIIIAELKSDYHFHPRKFFKVVCMIKIDFFDLPKKLRSVTFFKKLNLTLRYHKVSSKNNLRFPVKLSTENSSFQMNISYVNELQLPIKVSNEISQVVKCLQISLFKMF